MKVCRKLHFQNVPFLFQGKSLSIICGAIKWLKDHNEHKKKLLSDQIAVLELEKEKFANEEQDWFTSQSKEIEVTRKLNELKVSSLYLEIIIYSFKKLLVIYLSR